MALTRCPECGEQVSDRASACPHCAAPVARGFGYESPRRRRLPRPFRSQATLWGLPLVCVAYGRDPQTGAPRWAKGVIAIGDRALGVVAIGGLAVGGVTMGGVSLGVVSLGGLAIGAVAVGGLTIGYYALAGLALGAHVLGATATDPQAEEFFKRWAPFLARLSLGGSSR